MYSYVSLKEIAMFCFVVVFFFAQVSDQNESEGEPMDQGAPSTSSAPKDMPLPAGGMPMGGLGMKRTASDGTGDGKRQQQRAQQQVADPHWVLEKQHVDSIINFLIR